MNIQQIDQEEHHDRICSNITDIMCKMTLSSELSLVSEELLGGISCEEDISRYTLYTYHGSAKHAAHSNTSKDVSLGSLEASANYEKLEKHTIYFVLQSATLRLISSGFQLIATESNDVQLQPDDVAKVYLFKTNQSCSSDYLITLTITERLQIRCYTYNESSIKLRILDSLLLDSGKGKADFSVIGNTSLSNQFMVLCQKSNTLTAASYEIVNTDNGVKLITSDKQLLFTRSKLLYGSMTYYSNINVAILALWNCNRVCLLHVEWSQLNDDRNAYRFVLPNVSNVRRITHLNPITFFVSTEAGSYLMSSSQIKTGDWKFKPMAPPFNVVTTEQQCDDITRILQKSYQNLSNFEHSTLILVDNSDILVILSSTSGETKYFHLLKLKFAEKFYVTEITEDNNISLDIISRNGIERISVPLRMDCMFSLDEDYRETTAHLSTPTSIQFYSRYDTVSSFIKNCDGRNPWCIGKSGMYQLDISGCPVQHVATVGALSVESSISQQFVFDLHSTANCDLLPFRNRALTSFDKEYLVLSLECAVNINFIGFNMNSVTELHKSAVQWPFNVENTYTISLFPMFGSLFQVLPSSMLNIDTKGSQMTVYEAAKIFCAVGYHPRNEITLLSMKKKDEIVFTVLTLNESAIIVKKEILLELSQDVHDDTTKPFWFEGETLFFAIKTGNTISRYIYDIHGKLHMKEKMNWSSNAELILEYGFNTVGNNTHLYVQKMSKCGDIIDHESGQVLQISVGPSKMIQLDQSSLLIHDSHCIILIKDGQKIRVKLDVQKNSIEGNGNIRQVDAIIEMGQLVALVILFDTHIVIARGEHVSNILQQHRVRERESNAQSHGYFPHINRMVVYNARKQIVYALKLQTGKTVALEFDNVRDFRKVYYLSEVDFHGKCEDRNCYVTIVGRTKAGTILLKLCRISFKKGKLYMRQTKELRLEKYSDQTETVEVTTRSENDSELWITIGNKLKIVTVTTTNLIIQHDFGFHHEISELKVSSNLILMKLKRELDSDESFCQVGRINEFIKYGTKALVSLQEYEWINFIREDTLKTRFFEPNWLVIWGNDRFTTEGIIVFVRNTIHGIERYPVDKTTTCKITVRSHPVDIMMTKTEEKLHEWTVLHSTGHITTIKTAILHIE